MTKAKKKAKYFLSAIRLKKRQFAQRCPGWLKKLAGPILGGLVGLIGGIPGLIIGILLGFLLQRLFIQSVQDRRILEYFENPGLQEFYEGENGMAAWCALGVLISLKNHPEIEVNLASLEADTAPAAQNPLSEKILREVTMGASEAFPGPLADLYMMEHFSRLALQHRNNLNPDLLSESLAARRISRGDIGDLCRALSSFAKTEKAQNLSLQIQLILDPSQADKTRQNIGGTGTGRELPKDPWKILGLPPGTPQKEVKNHFRRLAKQFHPDELEVLDERQREAAAKAFIAIKEAYREIAEMK